MRGNQMGENETSREEKLALEEYDFGEKLRSDYFKHSWLATSILLPVCFSFVALSYTESLLNLRFELLPLALASIFLYIVWFWYDWRYTCFMKIIYARLQELEENPLNMNLHRKIRDEDPTKDSRRKSLGTLKWSILFTLIIVWILRMFFVFP